MKEEDKLINKFGKENPFSVPEGYFDNLQQQIMSSLPEKEVPLMETDVTTWQRIRPWLYMAAMFIAILLPIRFMINMTTDKNDSAIAATTENEWYIDEYIDDIMDYSMMDDYTLYQYLTSADTDYSFQ